MGVAFPDNPPFFTGIFLVVLFMKPFDRKALWIILALSVATSGWYAFVQIHDLGQLWSPLDDAFIYAQYAHEMAQGHPYEYYPGEGVTTGVTSPLYPWVLVPAFWVGLGGERIAWWWLGLGVLWRVWTALLIYALVRRWARDRRPALFAAVLALLHGNYNWALSSGMEVGLVAVALLMSLRAGQRWLDKIGEAGSRGEVRRRWTLVAALAVLASSRPEGTATAVGAVVVIGWWMRRRGASALRAWSCLGLSLVPVAAWLAWIRVETGTFATAGSKIKTMLGLPGFDWPTVLTFWFNGVRQTFSWDFLGSATMPVWGWVAGAMGCSALAWKAGRGWRAPSERLPLVWLVGLLVPAMSLVPFIQSTRYQGGHIPLLVGLGVYGVWRFGVLVPRVRGLIWGGLGGLTLILFLGGLFHTSQRFALHSEDMFNLQRRVAVWTRENLDETQRMGLTDAGIIPYLSGRPSIDFVGLTTREMMNVLASGPGAAWHQLEHMKPEMRPDYVALFPEWFDATDLGPVVARFRIDRKSIAVGPELVITEWLPPLYSAEKRVPPEAHSLSPAPPETEEGSRAAKREPSGESVSRMSRLEPGTTAPDDKPTTPPWHLVDMLDMGDLESEAQHDYRYVNEGRWWAANLTALVVAQSSRDYVWRVADAGRSWTSHEEFRLHNIRPDRRLRLSIRTYSDYPHRLRVLVDGRMTGILRIPKNNRSGIFDIVNYDIPSDVLAGNADPRIRVELVRDGDKDDYPIYTPFLLWALQPADSPDAPKKSPMEEELEERIGREEGRWAAAFRKKQGDAIPIDSTDQVLFQTGWGEPTIDDEGLPFRWGLGPSSFVVVPAPEAIVRHGTARSRGDETKEEVAKSADGETSVPLSYVLQVEVEPYVPPGQRQTFWNWIAAEVNGRELVRWDIAPRRQFYRCTVPSDLLYPNVNGLRFVYGRTYVPSQFEPGVDEARPFGGKFYSISLKPWEGGDDDLSPSPDGGGERLPSASEATTPATR